MYCTSTYGNCYGADDNIGNYTQYDIVCDPNIAYSSTKAASKLKLQVLSVLLCEGNYTVQINSTTCSALYYIKLASLGQPSKSSKKFFAKV